MHEHEGTHRPDWAERDYEEDLTLINENVDTYLSAARQGYEELGRGVIVVDLTQEPNEEGHPFFFSQRVVERLGHKEPLRMVAEYDPGSDVVVVLVKPRDRVSVHWVGVIPPGARKNDGFH